MFERATAGEPRNVVGDWALRGFIGLVFVMVGWDKFDSGSMWPAYFQQLGVGQWFRYFTGVVEMLGGLLVLVPRTVTAGLALLAVTMLGAAVCNALTHPSFIPIPLVFSIVLAGLWFSRRNRL